MKPIPRFDQLADTVPADLERQLPDRNFLVQREVEYEGFGLDEVTV